ncbi:MAG: NADP-dependent oxidoreductase [Gammaproteobacteria bacterium]|nr:NADP-dependent oxidoreductase [Gammaproteobacteria bacterium]
MNKQWILARVPPEGMPQAEDFELIDSPLPSVAPNQMLTRTIYLSLDPYQWGRRRRGEERPRDICHGRTVSQVMQSRLAGYAEGDYIFNTNGWQEYGLTGAGISNFGYMHPRKLDPDCYPISTALGVMGMLGLTAYAGLLIQCNPQPGETVVVAAASGGVGQIVCQLAKLAGCRVVGIVGNQSKMGFVLNDIGIDACVSHLSDNFQEELKAQCPDGCDVYFENVGGKVFEAILPLLNHASRISLCGLVSQYGNSHDRDPRSVWKEIGSETFAKKGIIQKDLFVGDFVEKYQDEFFTLMGNYVRSGEVFYKEDKWEGLEKAPEAFISMLVGRNFGKTMVSVSQDTSM